MPPFIAPVLGAGANRSLLDALRWDALVLQKLDGRLELFLQFVVAGGEVLVDEGDLSAPRGEVGGDSLLGHALDGDAVIRRLHILE